VFVNWQSLLSVYSWLDAYMPVCNWRLGAAPHVAVGNCLKLCVRLLLLAQVLSCLLSTKLTAAS
jgi:hypothetical protein